MNRLLLATAVLVASAACDRSPTRATIDFRRTPPAEASGGPWVARFDGDTISEAELARRFAEMNPYARTRYQTADQRREYLDGLVRFELLSREAVRQGLAQDPEVVEAARRVMVQQLLKKEVDGSPEAITDAQVKAYYEAHRQDYVKPAMTRLAHVLFKKEDRAKAEAALTQVKALPPLDFAAFGKVAREQSQDERTRALDGDLRFLADDELGQMFGTQLATAAAALAKVGDVAPTLVETDTALHVLKLLGRQQALNMTVEQARPSIAQVLLNETRQDRFRALLERLKRQASLEVNESALAAMVVDPKAPSVETKGPQPGFLPAPPEPPPTR